MGGRVQAMPQYLPGLVRAVEARDTGPRLTEGVERCKNLRMADKVRRAVVEGVALERVERAGETRNKIEPGCAHGSFSGQFARKVVGKSSDS